jgi:hypothetical protein
VEISNLSSVFRVKGSSLLCTPFKQSALSTRLCKFLFSSVYMNVTSTLRARLLLRYSYFRAVKSWSSCPGTSPSLSRRYLSHLFCVWNIPFLSLFYYS